MFDAKQAFRSIEGTYSLGELRTKLRDIRLENLHDLGPDIGTRELLELARKREWVAEQGGAFKVLVKK
jgi:hypothetical protein